MRVTIEATEADVEMLRAIANGTLDRDPSEPFANPPAAERMKRLADAIDTELKHQ